MLQGRKFTNPRHYTNPHCGVTKKWSQKESCRRRCRRVTGQQASKLLVLLMLYPVIRREMRMMKLVMRMRRCTAAAQNVLDQKRSSTRGRTVLTWLSLLLLTSRLHCYKFYIYLILVHRTRSSLHSSRTISQVLMGSLYRYVITVLDSTQSAFLFLRLSLEGYTTVSWSIVRANRFFVYL